MADPAFEPHGLDIEEICFTRSAYRRMLEAARESDYAFVSYTDPEASGSERACILRHDVDVDPGAALELARIEHDLGVRATYFVMTRSPVYNAFGRSNQMLFREITDLGHWIGLHYDLAFRPDDAPVDEWIKTEADVLATMLLTSVETVSFHQPMLSEERPAHIGPDGLTSAFDFPGFVYVSDANKALRQGSFIRLFREATIPRLQLCIHAEWWATDDPHLTSAELWDEALLRNLHRSQDQILATERGFGAPRIFSIGFGE